MRASFGWSRKEGSGRQWESPLLLKPTNFSAIILWKTSRKAQRRIGTISEYVRHCGAGDIRRDGGGGSGLASPRQRNCLRLAQQNWHDWRRSLALLDLCPPRRGERPQRLPGVQRLLH